MGTRAIYHFVPEEETFGKRLVEQLADCQQATLASAFFTNKAYTALKPSLIAALERKAKITFLLGQFDFVTEPRAVDGLLELSNRFPGQLRVLFDADFHFHYKLALLRCGKHRVVFIGSSNLTPKGLASIGEVNLEIIDNQHMHGRAQEIVTDRLESAIPAQSHLDAYRRLYNRASRYRRQRRRWENHGCGKLSAVVPTRNTKWRGPEGTSFPLCWIGQNIKDQVLITNVRKAVDQAQKQNAGIPGQWVLLKKSDFRLFPDAEPLVLLDDLSKNLGFAVCAKKLWVMGAKKEELVMLYRFYRGWKAHLKASAYDRTLSRLGFKNESDIIKGLPVKQLKTYLWRRRARN